MRSTNRMQPRLLLSMLAQRHRACSLNVFASHFTLHLALRLKVGFLRLFAQVLRHRPWRWS